VRKREERFLAKIAEIAKVRWDKEGLSEHSLGGLGGLAREEQKERRVSRKDAKIAKKKVKRDTWAFLKGVPLAFLAAWREEIGFRSWVDLPMED